MMDHSKMIKTDEPYSQYVEMVKDSLVEIQREISAIRKFLGGQKREALKQTRNESETLEDARILYEHLLKELTKMEQSFEEHLLHLKIDLVAAAKARMQPPSHLNFREIRKALSMSTCCVVSDETEEEIFCRCTWQNVPKWSLENTRNILLESKDASKSEFSETDLKFKQDMICLRRKVFSLPKNPSKLTRATGTTIEQPNSSKVNDFTEILKQKHSFPLENLTSKLSNLKFIEGKFKICNTWLKFLDIHGNQYSSKWHSVLCPQVEKILKKRLVPVIHLNPHATLNFMSEIRENGANFLLLKEDLIPLLAHAGNASWLTSWKMQLHAEHGKDVAARLIQAFWRGYWLRKRKLDSDRLYIAASLLWLSWITLKKKREIHERYLTHMLTSMQATRELSLKLSKDFSSIIQEPHVVLQLPSIGYPLEMRRTFTSKTLAFLENTTSLRICFVCNPKAEVIYILPVKPTRDLLTMYSDFIESMFPGTDVAKRITFVALSEAETFRGCSMNLSRILHCSEESLKEIRRKITDKPAYFLPWIIDECDMRLAGNLDVALLSPGMELQRRFLNMSQMSEMIENLGLLQPPNAKNIHDYETLCETLARLIVLHTEVCVWLLRLNFGSKSKHCGLFLINHISVPFMPILRREREKAGNGWMVHSSLREEFLGKLREHLPRVVYSLTQLSKVYTCWNEFYGHVQKFGCLLQAVPEEKQSNIITVCFFVPEKTTKEEVRWLGTADKIHLENNGSLPVYMMPQTSLDVAKFEPVANKFAKGMQTEGYFGYLTVDFYCHTQKRDEKLIVVVLNVYPYYSHAQSYVDWMKAAIGGTYNPEKHQFVADVPIVAETQGRKSFVFQQRIPKWNETKERYGIVVSQLYNTRFSVYSWLKLRHLFEESGITYDANTKQGSNIILHDSEIRNFGLMVAVAPCMKTTLAMVHDNLTKLHETLASRSRRKPETNLASVADFFAKLLPDYQNLATNPCI
ncbi:IQ motif-containing protein H-like isoform X1 [Hylaeus volcanicus]|uniref:IQ motif-containing protein H-like isoform X1 n=1 Tax=Hylaeus volcanicus TaxID=313075 RepID=UPI0023B860BC|nr:IQ motif-containing protein H-like isoform X1 [Hylaeus volcanicus]